MKKKLTKLFCVCVISCCFWVVDFDFNYSFNLVNKKSGTYNHHMIAALETELTSWLDFDISFVWDRTEDPRPEDDGTVPEKDDYYLIFSVGVEY